MEIENLDVLIKCLTVKCDDVEVDVSRTGIQYNLKDGTGAYCVLEFKDKNKKDGHVIRLLIKRDIAYLVIKYLTIYVIPYSSYEFEINEISNAMRKRLDEKFNDHKNTWKTSPKEYHKDRIEFLYKKLINEFDSKILQKNLIDLANQSMLLWLKIEREKKK